MRLSCNALSAGLYITALAAGCAAPSPEPTKSTESSLSEPARESRAEAIRDIAASRGLTNGALLGGIAQVESGLAQCWSESTSECQGPFSSSCNGPVLAGGADGACSAQQGGLGMFQFDGGTYDQTIARDGAGILTVEGNISHAVDFVAGMVRDDLGLASSSAAIAWMNAVPVVSGNATFNQWTAILACHYNGRCGSASQAALYGNATLSILGEFGAGFWSAGAQSNRVGVVATDGHLYVKEGALSASWTDESPSAVAVSLSGTRIGYLATNGHFYVKDGGLSSGWTDEYADVTAGYLAGDRIAVISGGHLLVKEGGLSTEWHDLSPSAVAVALTPTRVGYLSSNGHFYVKEGSLSASWSDESPSATAIALSGDRIGYLATNGHFYVKEGSLSASWSDEAPSATAIALGGTRIGYLATNGHFYVKEGSLSASWSDEAPTASSIVLGGDRIGYVATNGHFYVKEGSLSATWHDESPSVTAGALAN